MKGYDNNESNGVGGKVPMHSALVGWLHDSDAICMYILYDENRLHTV